MQKEIECIVTGRVQMVLFRDFVTRKARSLGLAGTVKNLPDGSVKVIAQGNEEQLKKLIDRLHQGSMLSHVEEVRVVWREPQSSFNRFLIIYH